MVIWEMKEEKEPVKKKLSTAELIAAVQKAKKQNQYQQKYNKFAVMGMAQRMTDKQIRYAMFLAKHFSITLDEAMMNLDKYVKEYKKNKMEVR